MISRAGSGTFEWMYPLRFLAAAGALLYFRRSYAAVDWRFSWAAPLIGGLVFALWIALDRVAGTGTGSMPAALAASPAPARDLWVGFRVLSAVVTVPIAEELAFRGFLLRRLMSAEFESISLQRWTLPAVAISSLAFGLMHGDRWLAGAIAGLLYAAAQKWRGRTGDAIVAHGVTNALIAARSYGRTLVALVNPKPAAGNLEALLDLVILLNRAGAIRTCPVLAVTSILADWNAARVSAAGFPQ